jgi:hypothetical protein
LGLLYPALSGAPARSRNERRIGQSLFIAHWRLLIGIAMGTNCFSCGPLNTEAIGGVMVSVFSGFMNILEGSSGFCAILAYLFVF